VAYGNAGSDRSSFNPVRDIDFRGNQGAYDQAKGILTTVAAVGTILLAPVVEMNASSTAPNPGKTNATEQTAKAGNTAAGKFKLARGWGKSTTSALRLKSGKIDAVGQTKAAANAGTRPAPNTSINRGKNSVKPTEPYNRRKHYGNTPTKADRKAIGGESVDHDPPLVKRYYEGDPKKGEKPGYLQTTIERRESANDRSRMKPSTKVEQNKQGAKMSKYSKEKKKEYGLE
jgi:hypothetical protein